MIARNIKSPIYRFEIPSFRIDPSDFTECARRKELTGFEVSGTKLSRPEKAETRERYRDHARLRSAFAARHFAFLGK
jgi:hypothetical protein